VIPIENKDTRPDWNAIRAEYIGGGISQRALAKKYAVSETTLMKKANAEKWNQLRREADSKAAIKAQQKTANAVASNAVLLEEAKTIAIKKIKKALEQMPENSGSHTRTFIQKDGKRLTVDYDLLDLVTALEKMIPSRAKSRSINSSTGRKMSPFCMREVRVA
jgi:hypothetical protein